MTGLTEREIVELVEACGLRTCSTEHHHGCPYGDEGMMDCVERLERDYDAAIQRLLALRDEVQGDCDHCANNTPGNCLKEPCAICVHFAARDLAKGDFWVLRDLNQADEPAETGEGSEEP